MKLISSKELIRTPIFYVTSDRALDPDGFEIKRAIVQHGGSAVMSIGVGVFGLGYAIRRLRNQS